MSEQADWRGLKLIMIIIITIAVIMMGFLITWFWSQPDTQTETAQPEVSRQWIKERVADSEDFSRSQERQERAEQLADALAVKTANQAINLVPEEPEPVSETLSEPEKAPKVSKTVQERPSGGLPGLLLTIRAHESGGNYSAYNAAGCEGYGCGGAYQLHAQYASGWAAEAGYSGMSSNAADWPVEVQDAVALYKFNQTNGGLWCDWVDYC
jgi:hypothetical protein